MSVLVVTQVNTVEMSVFLVLQVIIVGMSVLVVTQVNTVEMCVFLVT